MFSMQYDILFLYIVSIGTIRCLENNVFIAAILDFLELFVLKYITLYNKIRSLYEWIGSSILQTI